MSKGSRRKLANLVIDKRALARLSLPFLIMGLVSTGIVFFVRFRVMHALESLELHGVENLPAINTLYQLQSQVTTIGNLAVLVLTFVCFALWVAVSHRVFGPTVAMRRHVRALLDGDYSSRLKLRAHDELRELGQELNDLAEALERGSRG